MGQCGDGVGRSGLHGGMKGDMGGDMCPLGTKGGQAQWASAGCWCFGSASGGMELVLCTLSLSF